MGGAVGLAVSAAVLQATLRSHLPPGYYGQLAHLTYAVPANLKDSIPAADWEGILDAYMSASRAVFILQTPLIGLCLVGCVLIKDRGLERPKEPGEQAEAGNAANAATETETSAAAAAAAAAAVQEKQLEVEPEGKEDEEESDSTPQLSRAESKQCSASEDNNADGAGIR